MDLQTANRNLREALIKQMVGHVTGSLFAVMRFGPGMPTPPPLSNGIDPRDWHVVEVSNFLGEGDLTMFSPRSGPDDACRASYFIDQSVEIMGINMMGDVNMPHTWAASGLSVSHEQRAANWNTARAHAQALRNGAPQISGWEGAAKLSEAIQQKQAATQHVPSNTAQSLADEILAREAVGTEKYGTTVDGNPLPAYAWHQHGVEEALDLAMYLRRSQADARVAADAVETLFAYLCDPHGKCSFSTDSEDSVDVQYVQNALNTLRDLFPGGE